jgi:methyltransferase
MRASKACKGSVGQLCKSDTGAPIARFDDLMIRRRARGWLRWTLAICAAVGAERVAELAWSRAHERRLARAGGRPVEEPAFAWMAALHAGVLIAAPLESWLLYVYGRARPPRRVRQLAAVALAAATVLRAWTLGTLGGAWSVRVLEFPDGGRPVVTRGPYRHIRHPNYLAVIVELAALPLLGGAYVTAAAATLANAALLARRIPLEERALAADSAWREQMAGKPRFIPRLGIRARA